jgi:hypothetical protein
LEANDPLLPALPDLQAEEAATNKNIAIKLYHSLRGAPAFRVLCEGWGLLTCLTQIPKMGQSLIFIGLFPLFP